MSTIKTIFNGVEMQDIYHNGKDNLTDRLDEAYMDTYMVHKRMLEVELPQFSDTFILRDFLDSVDGIGSGAIAVTNNKTQPTMYTGDLTDMDITFINNGELQGTNPGHTALVIQSSLTLINNGWIRGAGGSGGIGGNGGKGANGAAGATKVVKYTTTSSTWPVINWYWSYGRNGSATKAGYGWEAKSRDGTLTLTKKPC